MVQSQGKVEGKLTKDKLVESKLTKYKLVEGKLTKDKLVVDTRNVCKKYVRTYALF